MLRCARCAALRGGLARPPQQGLLRWTFACFGQAHVFIFPALCAVLRLLRFAAEVAEQFGKLRILFTLCTSLCLTRWTS